MDSLPSAPSPDTANHAIFHPRPFFRPPEIAHPSALSCGLRPLASSPPPSHSDDGKDSGARRGRGSRPARPGRGARSPAASVRQPRLLGAGDGSNGIEATWARRSGRRRCTNASRVPSAPGLWVGPRPVRRHRALRRAVFHGHRPRRRRLRAPTALRRFYGFPSNIVALLARDPLPSRRPAPTPTSSASSPPWTRSGQANRHAGEKSAPISLALLLSTPWNLYYKGSRRIPCRLMENGDPSRGG